MRKKVNIVTITLYIFFLIGAVFFGWYDVKSIGTGFRTWPICVGLLAAMLLVGIIRQCLLKAANTKDLKSQKVIRVVSIEKTKTEGNVFNLETRVTESLPLIHVDNVDEKKLVIKLYKEKVLLGDSIGKIVNN